MGGFSMISMMNIDLKKSAPLEIAMEGVCAGACGRRKTGCLLAVKTVKCLCLLRW